MSGTSPETAARDNYLAWQADIGTEDVVLAAPFVRPVPAARPLNPTQPPQSSQHLSPQGVEFPERQDGPRSTPASSLRSSSNTYGNPTVGPDFFSTIVEKLSKPDAMPRTKAASAQFAGAKAAASAASALPEHADLEAYWTWIEATHPVWFPGTSKPLRALGHASPRLAVVELAPTAEGVFAGEAGALLDKMLRAISLTREDLYLTSLLKTPPSGKTWARKDSARMVPALLRELKLAHCELVLLLGEHCMQAVFKTGRGLAVLAGTAEEIEGMACAATWHPADLLADEARKKPAWEQLKWLQTRLPARGS